MPTAILAHQPRRVLVSPGPFKGSLPAGAVAAAMANGARAALPNAEVVELPLADGGDGSLHALAAAGFSLRPVVTRGPLGTPGVSAVARRGQVSVVELASACGIGRLPAGVLAPMTSTTLGLGDAVAAALDDDPQTLVVCVGGSASTDGGAGLLVALGARLLDANGVAVPPTGETLASVAAIDLSGVDPRIWVRDVVVATDVRSPLLGPDGAPAAFGPQKGATAEQITSLAAGLASWARVLAAVDGIDAAALADTPGAGAAGGVGLAVLSVLRGRRVPGSAFIQEALGVVDQVAAADLVITGEGRLDRTSLLGKAPGEIARIARERCTPVLAVCGRVDLLATELDTAGITEAVSLVDRYGDRALREPAACLSQAVRSTLAEADLDPTGPHPAG